jgi:hypothetical protein
MTTERYSIGRAINGVTINGLEYLLDEDGDIMLFPSKTACVSFLVEHNIPHEDAVNEEIFVFTLEV